MVLIRKFSDGVLIGVCEVICIIVLFCVLWVSLNCSLLISLVGCCRLMCLKVIVEVSVMCRFFSLDGLVEIIGILVSRGWFGLDRIWMLFKFRVSVELLVRVSSVVER